MKICIIFPPLFDPSMPYLAPYQLRSHLENNLPECSVDVFDLNVTFFNDIVENPYLEHHFGDIADVTAAYENILACEDVIQQALGCWSKDKGVRVSRQSIDYIFDQNQSENIHSFLNTQGSFATSITQLLENNVQLEQYDIIGFSITVYDQLIPSLLMSKYIKKLGINVEIVFGGNIVSRVWEKLFKASLLTHVDYLVRKEGELPLTNLILHLQGNLIQNPTNNLIDAQTGQVVDTTDFPIVLDLSNVQATDFRDVDWSAYFSPDPVVPIFLSRGCSWGRCTFCGIYSGWCLGYRSRTIDAVVDEIEHHIARYQSHAFRIVDESPSMSNMLDLAEEIIKRDINIYIESYSNLNPELCHEGVAETLYRAGFRQLFLGIESFDQMTLTEVNKEINDPCQYHVMLDNLYRHGIFNYGFFIIGLPNDTIVNEEKLEQFILKCKSLATIAVSSFIPITNSERGAGQKTEKSRFSSFFVTILYLY